MGVFLVTLHQFHLVTLNLQGSSILEILPEIVYERTATSSVKVLRELLGVVHLEQAHPLPTKEDTSDWFFLGRLDDMGQFVRTD